ncbi:GNAT family N-acetyltransferase [Devosia sp.]|uniref:GNAT family N-acetyltransferase n=1 Tax=Devosia sp. TaxID=1871048 RepID=UPI002AFEA380|nr:GNAT family N-acetyltransferase [Devosia sp.]
MLTFDLCRTSGDAALWADFFVRNLTDSYISHSELQSSRTGPDGRWSPRIREEIESELLACIAQADADRATAPRWNGAFTLRRDDQLAGLAMVLYDRGGPAPFGVIEDMLVATDLRGHGLGSALLDHVVEDMRRAGLRQVFLESGIDNGGAHHMFERRGFRQVSVVMAKSLEKVE